jgi:hypothetical protein
MMCISSLFFHFLYNIDFNGTTVQRYMEWTRVWSLPFHTVESAFFLEMFGKQRDGVVPHKNTTGTMVQKTYTANDCEKIREILFLDAFA